MNDLEVETTVEVLPTPLSKFFKSLTSTDACCNPGVSNSRASGGQIACLVMYRGPHAILDTEVLHNFINLRQKRARRTD